MKKVITGDHAVAIGAKLSRVDVVLHSPSPSDAYHRTYCRFRERWGNGCKIPHHGIRTQRDERRSGCRSCRRKGVHSHFIAGLAFMHEMVYATAPLRLPVVMPNANRTLGDLQVYGANIMIRWVCATQDGSRYM